MKILIMMIILILSNCVKNVSSLDSMYKGKIEELILAIKENDKDKIINILNGLININDRDQLGNTSLIAALSNDDKETVELLLSKGANINDRGQFGNTALIIASANGRKEIVELLLSKGANINDRGQFGNTALIIASANGSKDVVELLLSKGANINEKNDDGFTPLMISSKYGYKEIFKLLLERGANIDNKSKKGQTALSLACEKPYVEIAKMLLENCCQIDKSFELANIIEETAIDNIKNNKIENCLLVINNYKHRINFKYRDIEGNTFLHHAATINNYRLFNLFLNNNIDINALNKRGETPLYCALSQDIIKEDFIWYLINNKAILSPNSYINNKDLIDVLSPYKSICDELLYKPLTNILIFRNNDYFISEFKSLESGVSITDSILMIGSVPILLPLMPLILPLMHLRFLKKNKNLLEILRTNLEIYLLEKQKDKIKSIIRILKIKEKDFSDKSKKIMIKFIQDIFNIEYNSNLKVCDINTLSVVENSVDFDFNLDVFISILSNLVIEDFEESIKNKGIDYVKGRFIERLKDIKDALPINKLNKPSKISNPSNEDLRVYEINMKEYNLNCIKFSTKKQLYKLGLLISKAADSQEDKEIIRAAMNIILDNLVCHVGTLDAINQAVKILMDQDDNNYLKNLLNKEIMEFRIRLIGEVAQKHLDKKILCISEIGRSKAEYSNHMKAYLVMDLAEELKVTGLYENEFSYEYDKNFVINEVKKLYEERLIQEVVELVRSDAKLSNMVRDYLERDIFKTSSYLMIQDFIHDGEDKIKEDVIKALLIHFNFLSY